MEKLLIRMIESFVKKNKNPNFKFDSHVSISILVELMITQLAMRTRSLKLVFRGRVENKLQLGKKVSLKNLSKIKFGSGVKLSDYVLLDGLGSKKIVIGDNCTIGAFSRLITSTSYSDLGLGIVLGNNVGIGEWCYIGGAGGVSIGDGTIAGQYLSIHPENHRSDDLFVEIRLQGVTRQGISVGKNVWIGSKVTILDGSNIGDGCILAAGSVVTGGDYPENSIIGGVPARVLGRR